MQSVKVVRQVHLDEKIEQYIIDIVSQPALKYDLKELKEDWFPVVHRAHLSIWYWQHVLCNYQTLRLRDSLKMFCVKLSRCVSSPKWRLTYEAEVENMSSSDEIVGQILNKVEVPSWDCVLRQFQLRTVRKKTWKQRS